MRVKPAPQRMVRDPLTNQLLPEDGREVPDNQFWRRRIRDRDVVIVTAAPAPTAPPPQRRAE
ncbi:MAG TPA: DUF2635 domain-containing protein [Xanthobacteraceae bacterium]|nr:DUF2635 domain-containing protein [Xanthobacteraceae bacterium]